MGIFRKKKAEEPEPVPEPRVVPVNQDNWHEWASLANGFVAEGNLPKAIEYWTEAIGHFDDSPKYLEKLHQEISEKVIAHLSKEVGESRVVPLHMLAEIDHEMHVKHPDAAIGDFSDELFYHIKETICDSKGPGEAAMQYICASYSIIGYLRYSVDPRESAEKCQEVVNFGKYSGDLCLSFKKGYEGRLKPKLAAEFVETIRYFFENLRDSLNNAVDSISDEQYSDLVAYRKAHVEDRLEHLSAALQACIYTCGAGHGVRKRATADLHKETAAYIEEFMKME